MSDKTFTFKHHGTEIKGKLFLSEYDSLPYNDAVALIGWEPEGEYWENYATLSVNTDHRMMPGEFIANHDCTELVASLAEQGLFEPTGQTLSYGYVQNQPVYRITDKAREIAETPEDQTEPDMPDESMDGDHESGLASAGLGTDEDYGLFGDYDGGSLNGCEY